MERACERQREPQSKECEALPHLEVCGVGLFEPFPQQCAHGDRQVVQQLLGIRRGPARVEAPGVDEVTHELDGDHRVAARAHRDHVGDPRRQRQRVAHHRLQGPQTEPREPDPTHKSWRTLQSLEAFHRDREGLVAPKVLGPIGRHDMPRSPLEPRLHQVLEEPQHTPIGEVNIVEHQQHRTLRASAPQGPLDQRPLRLIAAELRGLEGRRPWRHELRQRLVLPAIGRPKPSELAGDARADGPPLHCRDTQPAAHRHRKSHARAARPTVILGRPHLHHARLFDVLPKLCEHPRFADADLSLDEGNAPLRPLHGLVQVIMQELEFLLATVKVDVPKLKELQRCCAAGRILAAQ